MNNKRIIVAISGASGAIYAERLLKFLLENQYHIDLIISKCAEFLLQSELQMPQNLSIDDYLISKYPQTKHGIIKMHDNTNLVDTLSSGTRAKSPMIVTPCSMKTLSGIAHGYAANLIERAADVSLKENLPLVLVPRETPLNAIHLENMIKLKNYGVHLVAAMPAFYQKPTTFNDLADFIVARILNVLNINHNLISRWEGQPI